jgi:hypothetical protein
MQLRQTLRFPFNSNFFHKSKNTAHPDTWILLLWKLYPGDNGAILIGIEELGRVEIHFFEPSSNGNCRNNISLFHFARHVFRLFRGNDLTGLEDK